MLQIYKCEKNVMYNNYSNKNKSLIFMGHKMYQAWFLVLIFVIFFSPQLLSKVDICMFFVLQIRKGKFNEIL